MDPAQHIIYEGILSNIAIGRLGANQTYETEIPVAFVSCGRFDVFADVRTVTDTAKSRKVGRGHLRAVVLSDGS